MKQLKKYLSMLALAALAFGAASCSDSDDYSPAPAPEGAQVTFTKGLAADYMLDGVTSSVSVELVRGDVTGTIDVPVTMKAADPAYATLFSAPTGVVFTDGSAKAAYDITFDRAALEDGSSYVLTLTIDDPTMTTIYGAATQTVTISVPEPWRSLGKGTFSDYMMFDDTYTVEIQQHELQPTRFRVVAPYNEGLVAENYYSSAAETANASEYFELTLMKPGNTLNNVPITRDDLVYFPPTNTGYFNTSNGYNQFIVVNHPSRFTNFQTEDSWSHNRVTKWQDDAKTLPAVIQLAPYYYMDGIGGWNHTTDEGYVTIVFPGVVVADYSAEITYVGRLTDPKEVNYAIASVTLGEDVEYALVGIAATDDPDAAVTGIINGSIESVKLSASGEVRFPLTDDGTYTIAVVTYGDGEPQEADYTTFNFYVGAAPEVAPLDGEYTIENIYGIEKKELFKTWIMWGINPHDTNGITDRRQPFAYVSFSESDEDFEDAGDFYDMINIEGFGLGITEDDAHLWEYYKGFILNFYMHENIGNWNGYYVNYIPYVGGMGSYNAFYDEIMMGGLVDEGYMALAFSGFYNLGSSPEPNGFQWNAYDDEACGTSAGYLRRLYNIMFEDPAVSSLSTRAAALKAPKGSFSKNELNTLAQSLSIRENYVETTRGMAHRKIDELRAKQALRNTNGIEILKSSKSRVRGAACTDTDMLF